MALGGRIPFRCGWWVHEAGEADVEGFGVGRRETVNGRNWIYRERRRVFEATELE